MSDPKKLWLVQAHPTFATAFTDSIWDSKEDAEARKAKLVEDDKKLGLDWDEWTITEAELNAEIPHP